MCKDPLFSIIVPLYNCADLTEQIVQKLNEQTAKCFEVLFINDGSKDDTQSALEHALESAEFSFRTFSQENAGPGAARNRGIDLAAGEYLVFLDADDYLEPDTISVLQRSAQETQADMLLSGYYQDFYEAENKLSHSITVVPGEQLLEDHTEIVRNVAFLDAQKVFSFAFNKATKTAIVRENGIRFSDRRHSEDYFFYVDVMPHIQRLKVLDKPLYHYIKSPRETLTNQPYLKNFYQLIIDRYAAMRQLLQAAGVYENDAAAVAANVHIKHIFSHFSNNCAKQSGMSGKAIRQDICLTLRDAATQEALSLAKARTRAEKIMNTVLRTRSAWLCYVFARAVYEMRNNKLFDKMK